MRTENLRNKYKDHPIIKPIIDHCENNHMGFELIKETMQTEIGIKCIKNINSYYIND